MGHGIIFSGWSPSQQDEGKLGGGIDKDGGKNLGSHWFGSSAFILQPGLLSHVLEEVISTLPAHAAAGYLAAEIEKLAKLRPSTGPLSSSIPGSLRRKPL